MNLQTYFPKLIKKSKGNKDNQQIIVTENISNKGNFIESSNQDFIMTMLRMVKENNKTNEIIKGNGIKTQ